MPGLFVNTTALSTLSALFFCQLYLEGRLNELYFGPETGETPSLEPRQAPKGIPDGHPLHMHRFQPALNSAHAFHCLVDNTSNCCTLTALLLHMKP